MAIGATSALLTTAGTSVLAPGRCWPSKRRVTNTHCPPTMSPAACSRVCSSEQLPFRRSVVSEISERSGVPRAKVVPSEDTSLARTVLPVRLADVRAI